MIHHRKRLVLSKDMNKIEKITNYVRMKRKMVALFGLNQITQFD